MNNRISTGNLIAGVFIVAVFLLAVTRTQDFDTWIHLSFGRLIWANHALPTSEPFAFSMAGKPSSYSSWLFGVIYYGAYRFLGEFGIVLLKALSAATLFLILFRDSLIPNRKNLLAVAILIVIASYVRMRFVERPDMFFMIFLAFTIFSLNAFLYDDRKYLYLLPVVHCLWANSHSSINAMVVPFMAVLVGGGIHVLLSKRGILRTPCPTPRQLKVVALVFALSAGASLLSPYGMNQYTFASQFLHSEVFKQQIVELLPPTWDACPWYYILGGVTLLSFFFAFRTFSFIELFLLLPFLYLSLTTRRFVFVFAIVASPVLVKNIGRFIGTLPVRRNAPPPGATAAQYSGPAAVAAVLAWIILWGALAYAGKVPLLDYKAKAGIGFDLSELPEGALSYLDRRGIQGPLYNTFQWGQYIVWRDYPARVPLMDGRGYMAEDLLESMAIPQDPEGLYRKYGVEVALVAFTFDNTAMRFDYGRDFLNDKNWALVYWDNISMVYLRRGGKNDPVIQRDEYRLIRPANHIRGVDPQLTDPMMRGRIIEELERNIRETDSALAHMFLAHVRTRTGSPQEALRHLSKAMENSSLSLRCLAYEEEGAARRSLGDIPLSLAAYEKSLKLKESPAVHLRIAEDLIDLGKDQEAIPHLRQAIFMNKRGVAAYPLLAAAYTRTG